MRTSYRNIMWHKMSSVLDKEMSNFQIAIAGFAVMAIIIGVFLAMAVSKKNYEEKIRQDPYFGAQRVTAEKVKELCIDGNCQLEVSFLGGKRVFAPISANLEIGSDFYIAAYCPYRSACTFEYVGNK